jgi:peroxin-6
VFSGQVKTSPVLRFNISRNETSDYGSQQTHLIHILPSPFGSHRPFIPTARAVTVARVGSPLSINKQYQDAFLRGLKDYFADAQRLIKQGDLIGVPIDASRSSSSLDANENEGLAPLYVVLFLFYWNKAQSFSRTLDEVLCKHQIVYFMITNVEYDILEDTCAQQSNDLYLRGRMGELGCWVDSLVTRIMQVGLEHSRIPYAGSYLDPGLSGLPLSLHYN